MAAALTVVLGTLERLTMDTPSAMAELVLDFVEYLILVTAMGISAWSLRRVGSVEAEAEQIKERLKDASNAGAEWRRRSQLLLRGLSEAIETQFVEWSLTPAEIDVATMIIKGVSSKDIARLRGTSEATVRQQAQAIYRKSGLSNRAELAAYFLDDLFDEATHGLSKEPLPNTPNHIV